MPSAETAADELGIGTALGVSSVARRAGEDWGEGRGGGILSVLGPTFHSLGVALSSPDMEGRFWVLWCLRSVRGNDGARC
jgi:hypothetical protein